MKNSPCITFLFMLLVCVTGASAQTSVDGSAQTIFDDLQTSKPGKGEVIVNQPEALRKMVGVRPVSYTHLDVYKRQEVFPEYKVCMVHGKMKAADKETEMQKFITGEAQILICLLYTSGSLKITYPFFMDGLEQQLPGLTGEERHFCCLLKLGLDNQQLAIFLDIQSTSVDRRRYRIRKKGKFENTQTTLEELIAAL